MIVIKSGEEIGKIGASCRIVANILNQIHQAVVPGIKTIQLEKLAAEVMKKEECIPAFKGYNGYPAGICVSVNDVVIHGIPGEYCLQSGDVVSVDAGVLKNGYYGDAAATFIAGKARKEDIRLLEATKKALENAIDCALAGNRLIDISGAVEDTVQQAGYSVVRDFVGHGIGQQLHEDPQIPNFRTTHKGPVLKPGMVLAIEPMVNQGSYEVKTDKDGWTVRTKDGGRSAHFEHTIAITNEGPRVLSWLPE